MALPIASTLYNNRSEKSRELTSKLPDGIRDGVFWTIGETEDGNIRVFRLQTPQDVLIGTKIFSIATNQLNMVYNKEKTMQEAAVDTLKRWGIKETRGMAYLMTPTVRFLRGLDKDKDPYDNTPLYPYFDKSKMSPTQENYYKFLFFMKCMVPFMSAYTQEVGGKIRPPVLAAKEVWKKFIGFPALGIQDYTEKSEVVMQNGTKVNYELYEEFRKQEQKEASRILDLRNDYIKSGMEVEEYYASDEYTKRFMSLMKPHMEAGLSEEQLDGIASSLEDRITRELEEDPHTFKLWLDNKILMTKDVKERKRLRNQMKNVKTYQMYRRFERLPKTIQPSLEKELMQ
jgi:hypothetical protein